MSTIQIGTLSIEQRFALWQMSHNEYLPAQFSNQVLMKEIILNTCQGMWNPNKPIPADQLKFLDEPHR